ncbi:hypothetical protein BT96DRAFT_920737, partial [Gymnopus androsaceus JB14]
MPELERPVREGDSDSILWMSKPRPSPLSGPSGEKIRFLETQGQGSVSEVPLGEGEGESGRRCTEVWMRWTARTKLAMRVIVEGNGFEAIVDVDADGPATKLTTMLIAFLVGEVIIVCAIQQQQQHRPQSILQCHSSRSLASRTHGDVLTLLNTFENRKDKSK